MQWDPIQNQIHQPKLSHCSSRIISSNGLMYLWTDTNHLEPELLIRIFFSVFFFAFSKFAKLYITTVMKWIPWFLQLLTHSVWFTLGKHGLGKNMQDIQAPLSPSFYQAHLTAFYIFIMKTLVGHPVCIYAWVDFRDHIFVKSKMISRLSQINTT